MAGLPQVQGCDVLERAGRVEARGQLVSERLVVNKAVGTGRADGSFVEAHRLDIAAVDARDLGAHQRSAVLKILRAVRRPHVEVTVMGGDGLEMLVALLAASDIAALCVGKRAIKVILRRFES